LPNSLFRLPDRVRHPKDAHWDEKLPCREVPPIGGIFQLFDELYGSLRALSKLVRLRRTQTVESADPPLLQDSLQKRFNGRFKKDLDNISFLILHFF